MIVTFPHSKEFFCRFVTKLLYRQVFLHQKSSSPVCSFIRLMLAVSHSNESVFLARVGRGDLGESHVFQGERKGESL